MATCLFRRHRAEQLCYLCNIRGGSLLCYSLINITSCLLQANKHSEWAKKWHQDGENKEMWGLDKGQKTLSECSESLWRTDDCLGIAKAQQYCLPSRFSSALNECHAPVSRIKPFEHLLSLTLPLFVWCAVTVNDFLKISIFHVWFTCLKCLVEQTQVCKAAVTAKRNPKSVCA